MPELEEMMKRQQVLAAFGEFAIHSEDLDAVLMEACRLVGEATGTGRAKVLEIQKGRQELLVRAGVGWAPDVVGTVRLQMGERSSETYAIKAARPVVTQDIAQDDRFDVPHFMRQAGVVALVNVPIFVPGERPYGVLQIDDTRPREFGDDEIEFLQTYAMILGPVIDRLHLVEERARNREKMKAGDARHSLLVESWAQAEWETDANGVVITDSPSWRAYTGQTVEEWLGYGWLDAIHPDDRAYAEKQWLEATAAHGLVDAEFRLHAPDGGWRWTNVRAAPVLDAGGGIVKWVGMNIDIDARKRAEGALRDNEERQAFQLRLSDALASLTDPSEIQAVAARLVAGQLDVGWCYFNEFDGSGTHATVLGNFHRDGLPSMKGIHDLSGERHFLDLMGSGAMLDMPDLTSSEQFSMQAKAAYSALGIRSALGVPLLRDGRLAAVLLVADPSVRLWARSDTELLKGVAERTWAAIQRARAEAALRDSEERFLRFSDASTSILWIRDAATMRMEFASPAFDTIYGIAGPDRGGDNRLRSWARLIVPEDRKRVVANLRRVRAGDRVEQEFRVRRGHESEVRWIKDVSFPLADEQGRVQRVAGVGQDITAQKRAEASLSASEARLQTLMAGIPQLVWRSCNTGLWTWASPQWLEFTGQVQEESQGLGWLDVIHPDDYKAKELAWAEARPHGMLDVEYRVRRATDGAWIWHHTRSVPVRNEQGRIVEWLGTSTDVQVLKEFQARQGVLVAELQHRTRNLIAIVRSTLDKTARASADLTDFRARFRDRLDALARVQGLLSRLNDLERVTFDDVIEAEMTAMNSDPDKVTLEGPPGIRLRSSTVQTLAMGLHELATNAVKYGALGQPDGRLAVTWRWEPSGADGKPWLHIEWRETGVIMAHIGGALRGTGQGRELIERALPYQLKAKTTYELGRDGVYCTISLPVSATAGLDEDHD